MTQMSTSTRLSIARKTLPLPRRLTRTIRTFFRRRWPSERLVLVVVEDDVSAAGQAPRVVDHGGDRRSLVVARQVPPCVDGLPRRAVDTIRRPISGDDA